MARILLEDGSFLIQEDSSYIIINEDILESAVVSDILSSAGGSVQVGVTLSTVPSVVTAEQTLPIVHLGVTIAGLSSSLNLDSQFTLSYGVTLSPESSNVIAESNGARAILRVGCWEIPFDIYTNWESRDEITTTWSNRVNINTTWTTREDPGDRVLLEDGFILLLEDGGEIKIAQSWEKRTNINTNWTKRVKQTC